MTSPLRGDSGGLWTAAFLMNKLKIWRGAREAEGDGLLNRCTVTVPRVRIPSSPNATYPMIEKINIKNRRLNIDFDIMFKWLTYLPFIGWMYPFVFKKNDAFLMHHAKQALLMGMVFTGIPIVLTFSSVFIPISQRWVKLLFVILIYVSHLTYFALCAWGVLKIRENSLYAFPLIKKFANKINV